MTKKHITDERGFTLIEMVVVVAIFAVAITITTDVFILAQRAQKKTASLQKLNTDLRFISNKITGDLRTSSIDYDYYGSTGPSGTGVSALATKDFEGKSVVYKLSQSTSDPACPTLASSQLVCPTLGKQCLIISVDGECASATSSDVAMDIFNVLITPGQSSGSQQTFVRLNMTASAAVRGQATPNTLSLQTSASLRSYKK